MPRGLQDKSKVASGTGRQREGPLQKARKIESRLKEHAKTLILQEGGTHVQLQYLLGNAPNKWDKSGIIVDRTIRVD